MTRWVLKEDEIARLVANLTKAQDIVDDVANTIIQAGCSVQDIQHLERAWKGVVGLIDFLYAKKMEIANAQQ